MNQNTDLVWVALSAFAGGVLSSALGWLDSKEPFDSRKFGKSAGFAILSGLGFTIGYSFSDSVGVRDVFIAILAGAGVDSFSNRALGASSRRKSPLLRSLPPSPPK